jgi:agmatine deiminase
MKPVILKYKMPPEWTKHQRTFIQWPVKDSMCWPENYQEVCLGYANVAKAITEFEPVTMIVNPDNKQEAEEACGPSVDIIEFEHSDAWFRDNGPTFIVNENEEIAGINWKFNAWGGKYAPWDLDDAVAPKLLKYLGIPKFDAPIVMEGGSIHVDGEGTLLTTEECLLKPTRNPDLQKHQIEDTLKDYVGIEKVIWLENGLEGDETDGHVDNIACFAKPGVILMQTCTNPEDANYEISQVNLEILRRETDALGRKFEVIEIPQPKATYYNEERLTLSYLNFYFVNNGIILPTFGDEYKDTDNQATEILQRVFPNYKIVKVDGMALVKEGGNIHCITQQMPIGK